MAYFILHTWSSNFLTHPFIYPLFHLSLSVKAAVDPEPIPGLGTPCFSSRTMFWWPCSTILPGYTLCSEHIQWLGFSLTVLGCLNKKNKREDELNPKNSDKKSYRGQINQNESVTKVGENASLWFSSVKKATVFAVYLTHCLIGAFCGTGCWDSLQQHKAVITSTLWCRL